jgi:hypothetical protein
MHFHDIDIGIAICHFELGCMERKINGVWVDRAHNIEDIPEKTTYVMSWEETK